MERYFSDLFVGFPFSTWGKIVDFPITGITADSRTTKPGEVFVAIPGYTIDSHEFIGEAVGKGASAVIGSHNKTGLSVPYVRVNDTREALAYLAAAYYSFPARNMVMIGVTGTDGKSTTCNLIYHILRSADFKTGMISTVNAVIGDQHYDTGFHVTTPGAIDIQNYLAEMVNTGITHCVLETTSHGWAQYRTDACEFDIGVVTNVTHEHLNQHGSYENYLAAKARLLESLALARKTDRLAISLAVLNKDDRSYLALREFADRFDTKHLCTYSLKGDGDLNASEITSEPDRLEFNISLGSTSFKVQSQLVGKFNVANCLAALGATIVGVGLHPQAAIQGLLDFQGVTGRMEKIYLGQDFTTIVDFAHTPNALKNVLETVREISSARVIAVFGSAGLRDEEKRILMTEVSVSLADVTILTAEDPRTENLENILNEMSSAALKAGAIAGKTLVIEPDRGQAIRIAIRLARRGDIVIVCGKGHEQSMCFGTIEYPWDDRTALRAALAEYLGVPGPIMPRLPTSE